MTAPTDALADRLAIVDTAVAYATALDTRDWALFESLFTPDAVWEYPAGGEQHIGPGRIADRIRPTITQLDGTQHVMTNHVVGVEGDTAKHTCYYLAQHLKDGKRFLAAGRYEDELRRVEGRWLLAGRVLISTWAEGDPGILQPAA